MKNEKEDLLAHSAGVGVDTGAPWCTGTAGAVVCQTLTVCALKSIGTCTEIGVPRVCACASVTTRERCTISLSLLHKLPPQWQYKSKCTRRFITCTGKNNEKNHWKWPTKLSHCFILITYGNSSAEVKFIYWSMLLIDNRESVSDLQKCYNYIPIIPQPCNFNVFSNNDKCVFFFQNCLRLGMSIHKQIKCLHVQSSWENKSACGLENVTEVSHGYLNQFLSTNLS